MAIGRAEIFTYEPEINQDNIIRVLQKTMAQHEMEKARISYLLEYAAGEQPLKQEKVTRTDIDCRTVDNVANEVCTFWQGYFWGQPITLVQRGAESEWLAEAVASLNACYEAEGSNSKMQKVGRFVEPSGIGFTYIDLKEGWQEGDSYFQMVALDPRYAFIIRSSYYLDRRPMVGVSYRVDEDGNRHYTAITRNYRFEIQDWKILDEGKPVYDKTGLLKRDYGIVGGGKTPSGMTKNPFGVINIVEYVRSHDRTCCFEPHISDMDDLNLNESNISNSLAETANSIWWMNDADFQPVLDKDGRPTGERKKPESNGWLITKSTSEGKTPIIQPLRNPLDVSLTGYILNKRALILQKCNVPQRNDNSGGSTGIAMSDATGWSMAEVAASAEELVVGACKMEEVRVALAVIAKSPYLPANSPLRKLRYSDVQPNMKRSKQYEMTSKMNAYATGVTHGIAPEHMLKEIRFFPDPQQVYKDSEPYLEKFYESQFGNEEKAEPDGNAERLNQDESDQISNSPNLEGMNTYADKQL